MHRFFMAFLAVWLLIGNGSAWAETSNKTSHVIIISFDGLRPDAISKLGPEQAPNFHAMIKNGASTLNARTDPDKTITMPNHICMVTGRGVLGQNGHTYLDNKSMLLSIHTEKGSYVFSIFDVAKEHGLTTGFFATKKKFQVFINSYGKKIDYHFINENQETMSDDLLKVMHQGLPSLTFVHFAGTDEAGHSSGWNLRKKSRYTQAVRLADMYLGKILKAIENNPLLAHSTVVIVTADHGGFRFNHQDVRRMENYRIPFIIWGKDVAAGMDLYKINTDLRKDPGKKQVSYGESKQPIRNGDAANCAMSLLGLPMVPDSTIGNPDPVRVIERR